MGACVNEVIPQAKGRHERRNGRNRLNTFINYWGGRSFQRNDTCKKSQLFLLLCSY